MSSNGRDLYAVLGVAPTASPVQITRAYRALLFRHHPDTRDAGMVATTPPTMWRCGRYCLPIRF